MHCCPGSKLCNFSAIEMHTGEKAAWIFKSFPLGVEQNYFFEMSWRALDYCNDV